MPLADQASAVARLLQQRRQGRMIRGQADIRVARPWLLEPQPKPILVAAGDQRETRGGADGSIAQQSSTRHARLPLHRRVLRSVEVSPYQLTSPAKRSRCGSLPQCSGYTFMYVESGEEALAEIAKAIAPRLGLGAPQSWSAEQAIAAWGWNMAMFSLGCLPSGQSRGGSPANSLRTGIASHRVASGGADDGAATGVCQLFRDAINGKFDDPTDAWLRHAGEAVMMNTARSAT